MHSNISLIIVSAFTSFLWLVLSSVVGRIFLWVLPRWRVASASPFATLLAGLTAEICVFSSLQTHGKTAMVFLVLLAIAAYAASPPRPNDSPDEGGKDWLAGTLGNAVVSVFFSLLVSVWCLPAEGNTLWAPPLQDNSHYTSVSLFLEQVGIESYSPDFAEPGASTPGPYHYYDAWLAALILRLLGLPLPLVYSAVVTPLLLAAVYSGSCELFSPSSRPRWWWKGAAFLSLFGGPIMLVNLFLSGDTPSFTRHLLIQNKLLPPLVWLVAAALLWVRSRAPHLAILACGAVGVAYASFPVLAGMIVLVLAAWSWREAPWRTAFLVVSSSLCMAGSVAVYRFFADARVSALSTTPHAQRTLRRFINIMGVSALSCALYAGVLLIFYLLVATRRPSLAELRESRWLPFVLGAVGGLATSACAWGVLQGQWNAGQLVTNPSSVVLQLAFLGLTLTAAGEPPPSPRAWMLPVVLVAGALATGAELKTRSAALKAERGAHYRDNAARLLEARPGVGLHFVSPSYFDVWWKKAIYLGDISWLTFVTPRPWLMVVPIDGVPLSEDRLSRDNEIRSLQASRFYRLVGARHQDYVPQPEAVLAAVTAAPAAFAIFDSPSARKPYLEPHLSDCQNDPVSGEIFCLWR